MIGFHASCTLGPDGKQSYSQASNSMDKGGLMQVHILWTMRHIVAPQAIFIVKVFT